MCPHKDLFYCFINKRKTLGIYIDLSLLWTPPLLFLSLGVGRAFSVCGIHCWKPHSPRRNSVSTSFLFQSMVSLWFCCSANSLQLNDQVQHGSICLPGTGGHVSTFDIPGTWHLKCLLFPLSSFPQISEAWLSRQLGTLWISRQAIWSSAILFLGACSMSLIFSYL